MPEAVNIVDNSLSGVVPTTENAKASGVDASTDSPRRSRKGPGRATANLGTQTERLQVMQETAARLVDVGIPVSVGNTDRKGKPVLVIAIYGAAKCHNCGNWHFGLSCDSCQSKSQSESSNVKT